MELVNQVSPSLYEGWHALARQGVLNAVGLTFMSWWMWVVTTQRATTHCVSCRPPFCGILPLGKCLGKCANSSPPPPPCISYALVQATVGVGTVIIVYVI